MISPYVRLWLTTVARLILGALFLWSGLVKVADPRAFLRGVVGYDATPDWLSRAIGYGLPVLEICVGLLLIIGLITRIAAAVAGVLQVFFLIAVIEVGARGIKIDTGAFSTGGVTTHGRNYLLVAVLNVVLIALAAALVWWPITRLSLDEFLARSDYVEPPSPKRLRSEQGRRKYEADVAAAHHATKERNRYLMVGLILPLVLISFISIGVQANRAKPTVATPPTNASHVEGVSVGNKASVNIDIFEDFQSKASLALEQKLAADFATIATSGRAQVRFHMVTVYDASSRANRYSTRAASASICASDISNKDFLLYHNYLFGKDGSGNQIMPALGSNGRTDGSLIAYAQQALGIGDTDLSTFQTCVQGEKYKGFVEATTQNFTNRGYTDVPLVLVNGVELKTVTSAGLDKAITSAAAKAPKVTPSATPSGSASVPASGAASVPASGSASVPASSSAPAPAPTS